LTLFFLAGMIILNRVDEQRGISEANPPMSNDGYDDSGRHDLS
jgi:hypothetical protein